MNNLIHIYHQRAANYGTPVFTALKSYMAPQSPYMFVSVVEIMNQPQFSMRYDPLPDRTGHIIISKELFLSHYEQCKIDMVLAMYAPYYICELAFLDTYTQRNKLLCANNTLSFIIQQFANYAQQNCHSAYTIAICHHTILRMLDGEPLHEAIRPHSTDYLQAILFQPQFAPMLMEQLLETVATSPAAQDKQDNLPTSLAKGILTCK